MFKRFLYWLDSDSPAAMFTGAILLALLLYIFIVLLFAL